MPTVYDIVTEKIVELLEKGTIPWRKPWNAPLPKNFISKKVYRGINFFMLNCLTDEYYLTYKQAKQLGGEIKKGSKGIPVVFWKFFKNTDPETGDEKSVPMLRYYTVFALSDTEGIDIEAQPFEPLTEEFNISTIEGIIDNYTDKPLIVHSGKRACYSLSLDVINIPEKRKFFKEGDYYGTLFHELIHSTGHTTRLNRKEVMGHADFGTYNYGIEELVAEMGSAYMCQVAGIDNTLDNSAAYIQSWIKVIKENNKILVQAAGRAQKACDYILEPQTELEEAQ